MDSYSHILLSSAILALLTTMNIRIRHRYLAGETANHNLGGTPGIPPPPPSQSTVDFIFNGSLFHAGQTVTYQALIAPGSPPSPDRVDIYLGVLLPDGVTFASFVPTPSGLLTITFGPLPVPFQSNVVLTAAATVPFSYTFAGSEPIAVHTSGMAPWCEQEPIRCSRQINST